jgi:hypothetical protein
MSYSFGVKARNKATAKYAVANKLAEIVTQQNVHARDMAAIQDNANAVIDLLADDDTKDVAVSCNGYVSWSGSPEQSSAPLTSVNVSCSASHTQRDEQPA